MNRRTLLQASLWSAVLAALVAACSVDRDVERDGGYHPSGFERDGAAEFHGTHLRDRGYPLGECRLCHGDDYAGGPVGVSCQTAGCHTEGVEHCTTCHAGGEAPPEPTSGGHPAHPFACKDCHHVPTSARESAHPDGEIQVTMTGLATAEGMAPTWSAEDRRCQSTYCHGGESPVWDTPTAALECDACHGAPPDSHARFPVAPAPAGCTPCHPAADSPRHLDGAIDFVEPTCAQCHGKTPDGAPPPALDGSTSPSSPGVGAHARHLDAGLSDRIGRAAACEDCHDVPASMRAEGHLDGAAPADVALSNGDYDPAAASCQVACHWDRDPGPVWTDTSGAAKACDACHDDPPLKTRTGQPHPDVEPKVAVCQLCHTFTPVTHVDGKVDFLQ